jgi:hypothetical protein
MNTGVPQALNFFSDLLFNFVEKPKSHNFLPILLRTIYE